jgi:hypothetical protein
MTTESIIKRHIGDNPFSAIVTRVSSNLLPHSSPWFHMNLTSEKTFYKSAFRVILVSGFDYQN